MRIIFALLVVLLILQQLSDTHATVAPFCRDARETPLLVQLVGYENPVIDKAEGASNLRNAAKALGAAGSVWELHYSLRYSSEQQQQQQQQYEHVGEGVLSFGDTAAAHSVCVQHDREHELLLQWVNDNAIDAEEQAARPSGASLCGGKYLVPIGRSITLSQAVLSDCHASYSDRSIESVADITTKNMRNDNEEESVRRQLQDLPTSTPTVSPTFACIPTSPPSGVPSGVPTQRPSEPTSVPTATPTVPTSLPSAMPTVPTSMPSSAPSQPSSQPTIAQNPDESEGSNSGGSSSSSGGGATAFFTSDAGYGTIAAAGVVGVALLATGAYFLWQYSGDLVKAPLAPQELAMQI